MAGLKYTRRIPSRVASPLCKAANWQTCISTQDALDFAQDEIEDNVRGGIVTGLIRMTNIVSNKVSNAASLWVDGFMRIPL